MWNLWKALLFLLVWLLLFGCSRDGGSSTVTPSSTTPVYVSIVLHNEEPGPETGYEDYRFNRDYYSGHREMLRRLALMLYSHGLPLNFQSDWTFLIAVSQFDTADSEFVLNTNRKNIIKYLHEDLGVEIDPHAHETIYNYADVAYLIEQLEVSPTRIAGGFISDPPTESIYEHFLQPIRGAHYSYTWQAEVLWGNSTYLHTADIPASGVWRPRSRSRFYVHDSNAPLVVIGKYTGTIEGIYDLINKIEQGIIPTQRIYTATIFLSQRELTIESISRLEEELLKLKALASEGKIVFATLQEVFSVWQERFNSAPNIYIPENTLVTGLQTEDSFTYQLDRHIPSDVAGSEGLLVRILYPKNIGLARYTVDGAPVVVFVPGADFPGSINTGTPVTDRLINGHGMIYIYFNFPGGYGGGGTYDSRGPLCQQALRDILLYALNKKTDSEGFTLKELIPYANTENVGVVGWSNGGNIITVVFHKYGSELEGIDYYVGYENPAGDEYVVIDLGSRSQPNPAYQPYSTVLDPVEGSVSVLDTTHLKFNLSEGIFYFDFNGNDVYDPADYRCGYRDYNGLRYFSTEILKAASDKGITLPSNIASLEEATAYWTERDMSRHFLQAASNMKTLRGVMVFSSSEDHVQGTPDYPHIVVNYNGWLSADVDFVRLNPDYSYVKTLFSVLGIDTTGVDFTDNDANTAVTLHNVATMTEPELDIPLVDAYYITASVLEMADRLQYDHWEPNLTKVLP
jgi:hypothetical protein